MAVKLGEIKVGMGFDFSISVEPDIAAVSARLKQYDERGGRALKNQMAKEMRGLGDKLVKAEQAAAKNTKVRGIAGRGSSERVRYKRGGRTGGGVGIRGNVANSIVKRNRLTGREAGVEIRASRSKLPADFKKMAWALNRGAWRHPVYGDRSTWATQTVSPRGFFWRTRDEQKPYVQRQIRQIAEKYMKEALKLGA